MEEKIETLDVDYLNVNKMKVRMPSIEKEGFLKITACLSTPKGRTRGIMFTFYMY